MAKSVVFVFSKLIKPNLTEIVLSFTFCVIIPFNFYIQNNTSIEVTFSQMFPWLMIAFVPVCVIFISIEFMLGMINEKWSFVFKALLSGILICSIIQAFFVTVDYGVFDGSTIDCQFIAIDSGCSAI